MPSKAQLNATARAHAGRQRQRQIDAREATEIITLISSSESENGLEPNDRTDSESASDEIEELTGPELMQSLEQEMEREADAVQEITLFDKIMEIPHSWDVWKRAESRIRVHYTGNLERTQRREKRCLEAKAEGDEKLRKRQA
jgi:hypothetical protein